MKDATQTITCTSATTPYHKRANSIDEQNTPVPKQRAESTANSSCVRRAMIPSDAQISPVVVVSWIEA